MKLAESGEQALESMAEQPAALVLLDMKMPGMDGLEVLKVLRSNFPATMVIMITGYPTLENAIECLKLGAMDYLVKPFRVDELETLLQKALETINPQEPGGVGEAGQAEPVASIIGKSGAMEKVFTKIRRAAPSDSTVLITGESGTGKELVARAIHAVLPAPGQASGGLSTAAPRGEPSGERAVRPYQGFVHRGPPDKHGLFDEAEEERVS